MKSDPTWHQEPKAERQSTDKHSKDTNFSFANLGKMFLFEVFQVFLNSIPKDSKGKQSKDKSILKIIISCRQSPLALFQICMYTSHAFTCLMYICKIGP